MAYEVEIRKRKRYSDTYYEIYLNGRLVESLKNESAGYARLIAGQYEVYGRKRRDGYWDR
ncbi:MAG: hypothetical protein NC489_38725 [Ruminococcus flavefaciens]|nr:hypothetical protein [Ruminococcus flavefaciens]